MARRACGNPACRVATAPELLRRLHERRVARRQPLRLLLRKVGAERLHVGIAQRRRHRLHRGIHADPRLEVRELQGDIVGVLPREVGIRGSGAVAVRAVARGAHLVDDLLRFHDVGLSGRCRFLPMRGSGNDRGRCKDRKTPSAGHVVRLRGVRPRRPTRADAGREQRLKASVAMKKQSIVADSPRSAKADRPGRPPGPLEGATFQFGAAQEAQLPPAAVREIAFAGRSNAGKSSAINALARHTRLAYVSRTPGRTQQINFFELRNGAVITDLPGYGYAAVPRALKQGWQDFLWVYVTTRTTLIGLVLVVDARHQLKPLDMELLGGFLPSGRPVLI